MKNQSFTIIIVAIIAFAGGFFLNNFVGGTKIKSESQVNLENDYDSLSYFYGLYMGFDLANHIMPEMDGNLVIAGLNTVLNDTSAYTPETLNDVAMGLQQRIGAKEAAKNAEANAAAAEARSEAGRVAQMDGELYLEANAEKPGVMTTESGLQYEMLVAGSGAYPTAESVVEVHYHGTLIDGTVFDSSVERGEPVQFPLNRVIRGWTEGLQLMNVGSKYKLTIPADLAYGANPPSEAIPPNSVLIFEVELISIQ